jgi:ATP-dependent RNA helicase DDX21
LCYGGTFGKTIVFTPTKHDANDLYLSEKLKDIEVLHGDIPQAQREITFKGFKEGRFHILVATDVASRGLDIPDVDLIVQCEPPKDVESYIHRSGRTARAGKGGTVITFYSKKHIQSLNMIEQKAGIKFIKVGAPQPEDIIKASSKFIVEGLKKVSDEALPLFQETAEMLKKEFGESKALLLTLAYISGNLTKIKGRSLLSGTENFITYQIDTEKEFRTVSYVWGILKRILPDEKAEEIQQMRCFKNNMGAAFDLPDKLQVQFEKALEEEKARCKFITYQVKKATQLPDLKEFEPMWSNNERGRGYGSYQDRGQSQGQGQGQYRGTNRYTNPYQPQQNRTQNPYQPQQNKSANPYQQLQNTHFNPADKDRRGQQQYTDKSNEIFIWGLKTEDDVKEFLTDNKIGWQRVKVLQSIS